MDKLLSGKAHKEDYTATMTFDKYIRHSCIFNSEVF